MIQRSKKRGSRKHSVTPIKWITSAAASAQKLLKIRKSSAAITALAGLAGYVALNLAITAGALLTLALAPGGRRWWLHCPLGEAGTAGAPAAIMNAINDALKPFGAKVFAQPFTPERILQALGKLSSGAPAHAASGSTTAAETAKPAERGLLARLFGGER